MVKQGASDTSLASNAVISSYYDLAVSKGAAARSRAAAAQSVSAAIAAGLLVLLATRAPDQNLFLNLAAALASSFWLAASALYLRAIAARFQPKGDELGAETADEFVRLVLDRARSEESEVDRRQKLGNIAVLLAMALSVIVVVGTAITKPTIQTVVFIPNDDQRKLLAAACGDLPEVLRGTTRGELAKPSSFFIDLDPEQCGGQTASLPAGVNMPNALAITEDGRANQ